MRPRGLSSSSPSKTYVGQVAVQNPQCVQVRKTFSLSAVSGSASCSAVKSVRTGSAPFDHASGIEDPTRIKAVLDASSKRSQRRRLGLEHRDSAAQPRRASDQGGVTRPAAIEPTDRGADHRCTTVAARGDRHPQQPASPIQIPAGVKVARDGFPELGTAAWRDRYAPNRPLVEAGQWFYVADSVPEGGGRILIQ